MPIDLAPHDIVLQDWGCPARLRQAVLPPGSTPVEEFDLVVIPQTVRLTQTDHIASVQADSRTFLVQGSALPSSLSWLDCELLLDNQIYRVTSAEDSGMGGWVLLETFVSPPRTAL